MSGVCENKTCVSSGTPGRVGVSVAEAAGTREAGRRHVRAEPGMGEAVSHRGKGCSGLRTRWVLGSPPRPTEAAPGKASRFSGFMSSASFICIKKKNPVLIYKTS